MRYTVDHDIHIHSYFSKCSNDTEQMPIDILHSAEKRGLKYICLTDHYWDERIDGASSWYSSQNTSHIQQALPLPTSDSVRFFFGCETEMREDKTIGISGEMIDSLDFIIIPTTHLHMKGFTIADGKNEKEHAIALLDRTYTLLDMDLPFNKIGIPHLVCSLASPSRNSNSLYEHITDADLRALFKEASAKEVGIELNADDLKNFELLCLRVFGIARNEGCKFYLGSDAHHPKDLSMANNIFADFIDKLELTETDKFIPPFIK